MITISVILFSVLAAVVCHSAVIEDYSNVKDTIGAYIFFIVFGGLVGLGVGWVLSFCSSLL